MIVCLCTGVNDRTIRSVINEGAKTVNAVADACGAGTGCGTCRNSISCLIEEGAHEQKGVVKSGAFQTASAALGNWLGATLAGT